MVNPIIWEMDHYVILEPGKEERIADRGGTRAWLEEVLAIMVHRPADLDRFPDAADGAAYLLDTACELEVEPGQRVQWYAVRLQT